MFKRTCLEERMFNILNLLQIEFTEQVSTRSGFVIDFAVYIDREKGIKFAIETDGAKWHSSSVQRRRDGFRDYLLRKEGWKVVRFGEEFNIESVKQTLTQNGLIR
jgi:very-short-patch-repair endonuclease